MDKPKTTRSDDEILAAYEACGGSIRATSKALGNMDRESLRNRLSRLGVSRQDPAIAAAAKSVGTNMIPTLAWAKTKPDENGMAYSVLLKPEPLPDDTLDRIRAAFESMKPADPVVPPGNVMADLCNVIPLFDVHFGMHAWGRETGVQNYDMEVATGDLKYAFEKVLSLTPVAEQAILIIGGDFFHADDNTSETPANKHKLDVTGGITRSSSRRSKSWDMSSAACNPGIARQSCGFFAATTTSIRMSRSSSPCRSDTEWTGLSRWTWTRAISSWRNGGDLRFSLITGTRRRQSA